MPNATYYKKLGQAVDEILAELKRNSISAQHWAVNWGDLHCTQIEERKVVYPEREDKTIVILIEEADPGCSGLQAYVEDALFERGYNVSVEMEW